MPRPKTKNQIRLNLAISEVVRDRLDSLQERTDADSMTEVIRRALAVYEELVNVHEAGGTIILVEDGEEAELRIVPGA